MLVIRLLGRFEVRRGDEPAPIPSRAAQSLLAYLLLNPNIDHRREKLAGLLAPDSPDEKARAALRHALWVLRKALGPAPGSSRDYLVVDDLGIRFDSAASYSLDVDALAAASDPKAGLSDLMAALMGYDGELLPGFYDDWVLLERSRLAALFESEMRRLLDGLMTAGRWEEVLTWAERWIAAGETPEAAYRALMVAHAARGDTGRAAAAYGRCVDALHDDLGVDPAQATRDLYEQIAAGRSLPGLPPVNALPGITAPAPVAAVAGEAPFKGLQCFEMEDAGRFFGREEVTARLVERLRTEPLLFVVGASGSGKSSLVRAGLIPALMAGAVRSPVPAAPDSSAWRHHLITPGAHPLQALAVSLTRDQESLSAAATLADDLARDSASLALYAARLAQPAPKGPGPHLFLAVDQFEEVFTLCRSEAERAAFIDNLLAACPHSAGHAAAITLVITLRADFYRHCADYSGLRAALASQQEYIGAMSAAELRRAIECPAQAGGWSFEDGLINEMLHDAGSEPGSLPLLSHALLETWRRRRGRVMTLGGYAASGGVAGAIAHSAESAYSRLTPDQQQVSRGIFLRLTELGEGVQDTRRRAALSELAPDSDSAALVGSVLEVLAQSRLITVAEGTAEVAHEALIREWPRLREWLAEDREGLRLHHRLAEAAQAWAALERDAGELYRGARLARTLEWAAEHSRELNTLEREFVAASSAAAAAEEAEREAQQRRELEAAQRLAIAEMARAEEGRQSAGRLRRRAVLLATALALAVVLGGVAALLAFRERQAAHQAGVERSLSFSRELAFAANLNLATDPELSALLAVQAVSVARAAGLAPPVEVEDALHRAVQAQQQSAFITSDAGVAISPDLALAATASRDGTIRLWPNSVWRPTGQFAGDPVLVLPAGPGPHALAFSPDHKRLAVSTPAGAIDLWDTLTGVRQASLGGHSGAISSLAFSRDGAQLASLGADGTARLWDSGSGAELLKEGGAADPAVGLDISPDGASLAVGHRSGQIVVWDLRTRTRSVLVANQFFSANVIAFCGSERLLVHKPGSLLVYNVRTGANESELAGMDIGVKALACNASGSRLLTAAESAGAKVWELRQGRQLAALAHSQNVVALSCALRVPACVGYSPDGSARVWNLAPGRELAVLSPEPPVRALALAPDGQMLVWAAGTRLAGWSIPALSDKTGSAVGMGSQLTDAPSTGEVTTAALAFSLDGGRLASGCDDGQVYVWHVSATGVGEAPRLIGPEPAPRPRNAPSGPVVDLAFSPDGMHLAAVQEEAGEYGRSVQLWDLSDRGPAAQPRIHPLPEVVLASFPRSIAFSPDGGELAVGLSDGSVQLVDARQDITRGLFRGHADAVTKLAYSPDGSHLATAGAGGILRIWALFAAGGAKLATPVELLTLQAHSAAVTGAAFTPDGARLLTASLDGTVRIWDVVQGRELIMLASGDQAVTALLLSRDGTQLAALSDVVRLYVLPLDDVVALARQRIARSLSPEERVTFLHEAPSSTMLPATAAREAPPVATPAEQPEHAVRRFVDAWNRRDKAAVAALFANQFEYTWLVDTTFGLSITTLPRLRGWFAFIAGEMGQDLELDACTTSSGGVMVCRITAQTGCDRLMGYSRSDHEVTFAVVAGKITKVAGRISPAEVAESNLDAQNIYCWGVQNMPEMAAQWMSLSWGNMPDSDPALESRAREAGRLWAVMCNGYAAAGVKSVPRAANCQ